MPDIHDPAVWISLYHSASAHPSTRRIRLTWPSKETAGGDYEVVYLPKHLAILFEHLEAGSEVEVTVKVRNG